MYQTKDVMTAKVISIPQTATLHDAIQTLLANRISGAPVVAADGSLVGVISEFPLLETIFDSQLRTRPVCEFMTKDVISVHEDMLLADVASLFVCHRIRRVPVVRDGQLVGIVSRSSLLRYVSANWEDIDAFLEETRHFAESCAEAATASV